MCPRAAHATGAGQMQSHHGLWRLASGHDNGGGQVRGVGIFYTLAQALLGLAPIAKKNLLISTS